jgi:hypothetical protein
LDLKSEINNHVLHSLECMYGFQSRTHSAQNDAAEIQFLPGSSCFVPTVVRQLEGPVPGYCRPILPVTLPIYVQACRVSHQQAAEGHSSILIILLMRTIDDLFRP